MHNLNSCTEVFSSTKKLDYIKETEKYIIHNLKKLRKQRKELYSSITFLIYNLKNQMTQLRYVVDLEKRVQELKDFIKIQEEIMQEREESLSSFRSKVDSLENVISSKNEIIKHSDKKIKDLNDEIKSWAKNQDELNIVNSYFTANKG